MIIDHPHGYLKDSESRIILRFANWAVGEHTVPDVVESVEYVDGPKAHDDSIHGKYQDGFEVE